MNKPISLGELGQKVGIPAGRPVSMGQIAEMIGYAKRPISLAELAEAVDEFAKQHCKKDK